MYKEMIMDIITVQGEINMKKIKFNFYFLVCILHVSLFAVFSSIKKDDVDMIANDITVHNIPQKLPVIDHPTFFNN